MFHKRNSTFNNIIVKAAAPAAFTVMELMVAVAISAIVSVIVTPEFSKMVASFDRFNVRTDLIQDLKRAQAEALTQGCRGIFRIAANGKSYSFGCDYLEYDATNPPSADSVSFMRTLPNKITISTTSPLIFNSRGESVDVGNIISNNSISIYTSEPGTPTAFASGTILGTGVFSFD